MKKQAPATKANRSTDKVAKEFAQIKSLKIPAKRIVWGFSLVAGDKKQLSAVTADCVEFLAGKLGSRQRVALDVSTVERKTMHQLFLKLSPPTPAMLRQLDRGLTACCQGTKVKYNFLGYEEEVYPRDSWKTLASVLRPEATSGKSTAAVDCRELRFDGLYYHDLGGGGDYLRFYPDGQFVSAAVSGDEGIAKVAKWLRREKKDMEVGTYTLKATTLQGKYEVESFPDENPIQIKIKARLTKQGLKVRTWSSYSNDETEATYSFYDVTLRQLLSPGKSYPTEPRHPAFSIREFRLMTINPYSLPNPSDHDRYFTDDNTLMPVGFIWQTTRGQPLFTRALVFVYFVIRKVLRQRMPASHGTRYPPKLTAISHEELPEDARHALATFDDACQAAGMQHLGYFRPSWIGQKRGVLSIRIDPGRIVWCSTTWFEIHIGEFRNSRTIFACHSETLDGRQLITAPETGEIWIPQMIPPNAQIDRISSESSVTDVINHHKQTIADQTDIAVWDPASLIAHIEQRSRELSDFLISKGFYAELAPEEIDRLRQSPAS